MGPAAGAHFANTDEVAPTLVTELVFARARHVVAHVYALHAMPTLRALLNFQVLHEALDVLAFAVPLLLREIRLELVTSHHFSVVGLDIAPPAEVLVTQGAYHPYLLVNQEHILAVRSLAHHILVRVGFKELAHLVLPEALDDALVCRDPLNLVLVQIVLPADTRNLCFHLLDLFVDPFFEALSAPRTLTLLRREQLTPIEHPFSARATQVVWVITILPSSANLLLLLSLLQRDLFGSAMGLLSLFVNFFLLLLLQSGQFGLLVFVPPLLSQFLFAALLLLKSKGLLFQALPLENLLLQHLLGGLLLLDLFQNLDLLLASLLFCLLFLILLNFKEELLLH